jgi:PhnB protein
MATRLNPYLSFTGKARQALEFYRDVFGGDLNITTFGEFGAADDAHADQVMHGMLDTTSGYTLMAADAPPGMKEVTVGNNMVISLSGDDDNELRMYWDRLSKKGSVSVPLEKQVWGDEYGARVDQFGVEWMVNISHCTM